MSTVKKVTFTVCHPSKMQVKINRQKVSKYFKSHYISDVWRNSGSWRISELEKPVPMFSKTLFLDMKRSYNLLISENITVMLTIEQAKRLRRSACEAASLMPREVLQQAEKFSIVLWKV